MIIYTDIDSQEAGFIRVSKCHKYFLHCHIGSVMVSSYYLLFIVKISKTKHWIVRLSVNCVKSLTCKLEMHWTTLKYFYSIGLFFMNFLHSVNEQKCSTVNEQKCSTVQEQQCSTVNERECSTVNRQQCSTVQDRQCSTSYEQECRYWSLWNTDCWVYPFSV